MRKLLVIRRPRAILRSKSRSILQLQVPTRAGGLRVKEYPLRDLDGVLVIGARVYVESGLLGVLAAHNTPLTVVAKDKVAIMTAPIVVVDNHYRLHQYTTPPTVKLAAATAYIQAKLQGMTNIARHHGVRVEDPRPPPTPTGNPVEDEQLIRSWEAEESARLWKTLTQLIDESKLEALRREYGFQGRKPRHPDPFNKALSIMYSVLYTLATKALLAAGLDPTLGLLHKTRYSTPLTFDYTETYKPIAIQATMEYINENDLPRLDDDMEITREDVNKIIRKTYDYLTLRHKKTKKTIYQYIFTKARCLAHYLAGRCTTRQLPLTWNPANYTGKRRPDR